MSPADSAHSVLREMLRRDPAHARRLLALHEPAGDGSCVRCHTRPGCTLGRVAQAVLAELAKEPGRRAH